MTKQDAAKAFENGRIPTASAFRGDGVPSFWRVDMLSGPIPNMGGWPLRHRKSFTVFRTYRMGTLAHTHKYVLGHNLMLKAWRWGFLRLMSNGDMDYASLFNGRITQRIHDELRTTGNPNVIVGKFFFRIFGRRIFLGYFSLTRIVD